MIPRTAGALGESAYINEHLKIIGCCYFLGGQIIRWANIIIINIILHNNTDIFFIFLSFNTPIR